MLYVNGFQHLHRKSILIDFLMAHDRGTEVDLNIHTTSQNFFWHSYFLFELENSFRDLGGEYECFTLPYWDITNDEAAWSNMTNPKSVNDLPIYNAHLGGEGDPDNDYCVGDPWSRKQYITDSLCADDEAAGNCCLKRYHYDVNDSRLYSKEHFAKAAFTDSAYAEFGDFSDRMSKMHGHIHQFFATKSFTHFNPGTGEPAADPLFAIFHSFIEYIRLLRQDCYQFDLIPSDELEFHMPYAYEVENCSLDFGMDFSILCDGTNGEGKRMCSTKDITPRLMYDVSPNRGFGIVYELGEFWNDNDELKAMCSEYLNDSWWNNAAVDAANDEDTESDIAVSYQLMKDLVASSSNLKSNVTVILMIVIGVTLLAVITYYRFQIESRKRGRMHVEYGTV